MNFNKVQHIGSINKNFIQQVEGEMIGVSDKIKGLMSIYQQQLESFLEIFPKLEILTSQKFSNKTKEASSVIVTGKPKIDYCTQNSYLLTNKGH